MLKFLKNLLGNRPPEQSPEAKLFAMGYDALQMARKLESEGNDVLALSYYDIAIDCGLEEAYQDRGLILQVLDYDLEAIEDFDKAEAISPNDPNLFFGRHLSKSKTGDFDGAVSDVKKAVALSKASCGLIAEYDDEVQKKGYRDSTHFFETWMSRAIADANRPDEIKGLIKRHVSRRPGK